jgi:ATP-dependent Clp protease ATP-binding subunit ClpX
MYELPSLEGVSKVVVDEAVVEGSKQPYLVYEGGEPQKISQES